MNNLYLGKTNSIEKQLKDVKIKKKEEYYWSKNNLQSDAPKENITAEKGQWPKNTTLIVGDFIINGILEEGSCSRNVRLEIFLVRQLMIWITISLRYSKNSLVTS